MSEYHKIETLYVRDEKTHRLVEPLILKNPVYGLLKTWQFTEKIDGTNIRVIWSPAFDSEIVGKPESLRFGGKTDNAQLPSDLVNTLRESVTAESLRAVFPAADAVLYGEGYGAGIQKGGDLSPTKKFVLFDVLIDGKWWLSDANVRDVGSRLKLDVVPFIGEWTLEDATSFVRNGFQSALGKNPKAEGLVGRPMEALFDKKGARLIVKLKTEDFA